jgi:hypothetical protein
VVDSNPEQTEAFEAAIKKDLSKGKGAEETVNFAFGRAKFSQAAMSGVHGLSTGYAYTPKIQSSLTGFAEPENKSKKEKKDKKKHKKEKKHRKSKLERDSEDEDRDELKRSRHD